MTAKRKKDRKVRRELLFTNTQPVVGGWLTSCVMLELHFAPDAEVTKHVRVEEPGDNPVQVERQGVGPDDPRLGTRGGSQASLFPGDTHREPQELEEFLAAEESDAFPEEAAFTKEG